MSFIQRIAEIEKAKAKVAKMQRHLDQEITKTLASLPFDYGYPDLQSFIKALKKAVPNKVKKSKPRVLDYVRNEPEEDEEGEFLIPKPVRYHFPHSKPFYEPGGKAAEMPLTFAKAVVRWVQEARGGTPDVFHHLNEIHGVWICLAGIDAETFILCIEQSPTGGDIVITALHEADNFDGIILTEEEDPIIMIVVSGYEPPLMGRKSAGELKAARTTSVYSDRHGFSATLT